MKKAVVTISDAAKQYIETICNNGQYYLAVTVTNTGCSGHAYEYKLVDTADINKFDELIDWQAGGLVVRSSSVMQLLGSHLDLAQTISGKNLQWQNPNITSTCGCGESFSLTR